MLTLGFNWRGVLSFVLLDRTAFPYQKISGCYWRDGCLVIPGDQTPLQPWAGMLSPVTLQCKEYTRPHQDTHYGDSTTVTSSRFYATEKHSRKPKLWSHWMPKGIFLAEVEHWQLLCPRPRQILCFITPLSCFVLLALLIVLLTACPSISDLTACAWGVSQ